METIPCAVDRAPVVVTIRDVAQRAGVSQATASRVLTDAGRTSETARERVRRAADELGYRVNKMARSLRTQRTDTIGLLIPDVRNPFFAELAYVVEQAAAEEGIAVITMSADEREDRQANALRALTHQQVDGLIVAPQGELAADGSVEGIPVVYVDRTVDGSDIPVVRSDNADGARQMIDHLVAVGHRDIALITGPRSSSTSRERLAAALDRLAENGCTIRDHWVLEGNFQLDSGLRAAAGLFAREPLPTAVFAADNLMAVGALVEARHLGLRIGRDIAITAFDDTPWFAVLDPPLTAVAQDVPGLGRQALDALRARMAGEPVADAVLPVQLVVRSSCALPTARILAHRRSS